MDERYNRSPERSVAQGAEAARQAGRDVADLVHEKQLAYGDSSGLQYSFWRLVLEPYKTNALPEGGPAEAHYVLPASLVDQMPRLTRVMDRVFRIVSNPAKDRMGEDPWRDLAGDAVCGMVMPVGTRPTEDRSVTPTGDEMVPLGTPSERGASPFRPGTPCPHCSRRDWQWMNPVYGACSLCPRARIEAKHADCLRKHGMALSDHGQAVWDPMRAPVQPATNPPPGRTRPWNEGPVHPDDVAGEPNPNIVSSNKIIADAVLGGAWAPLPPEEEGKA